MFDFPCISSGRIFGSSAEQVERYANFRASVLYNGDTKDFLQSRGIIILRYSSAGTTILL